MGQKKRRFPIWPSIKWLSLGIAITSIVLAIVLMRMSGVEQAASTDIEQERPGTQVESPVIIERKDGAVVWQLRAQEASQQLDGRMLLSQPKLVLYTKSQQKITIVGQMAWFNPLTRNIRFEDQVLVNYDVWSISTDVLRYVSASDELHIPQAFKLWGKNIKAEGNNMHLHRHSEQVNVDDGITIEDSNPDWQGVTP